MSQPAENSERRLRLRQATPVAGLTVLHTDDGSRTLFCERTGQTYHSESGAASESSWVFVRNGLSGFLAKGNSVRVLEIGLGTGLNLLLSVAAAQKAGAHLTYLACDTQFLSMEVLQQLDAQFALEPTPEQTETHAHWLRWMETAAESGLDETSQSHSGCDVHLFRADAQDWVNRVRATEPAVDVVYLDAFSPEACPELWAEPFLASLGLCLRSGGKLVTYCVKSEIQRRLRNVGFDVQKSPGPAGGKREVLIATRLAPVE